MDKTKAWQEYEKGVDYKNRIGLYSAVNRNERFFAGDQWAGIPHEGLPTPVTNFIKYASAWKIAAVTDRRLELNFFAEGEDGSAPISIYANQVSKYCDTLWERLKMDYLTKEGLKQACITGDYIQYFYWDDSINTGQAYKGDIATQLIDNVNYYPGNPNNPNVQEQPYIILTFREHISKVKEIAERNGVSKKKLELITGDAETENTAGDRGKIELDDSTKINVLLKLYKKNGKVYSEMSTRAVVIQKEKDTRLTNYPVALMNWETRKNCCHGEAEVTYLIPNQVYVNKRQALEQIWQLNMSNPKIVYDKSRIKKITNKPGGLIPVNGDVSGAIHFANPPSTNYDAQASTNSTVEQTMRMMGANDVTLGNIKNPDNTSAFIATRDAAMVPLQLQEERFYGFVEQVGVIWIDFIQNFYGNGRTIPIDDGTGRLMQVPIPTEELQKATLRIKIDVGPASMWSEIQTMQTLDNLLQSGQITLVQYLERIPEGFIPQKERLIEEERVKEQQMMQQQMLNQPQ